jgi:hypothetical protein
MPLVIQDQPPAKRKKQYGVTGLAVVMLVLLTGGIVARVPLRQEALNSTLRRAAWRGDSQRMALLLDRGADPNAVDWSGQKPLHLVGQGYMQRHHFGGITGVHPELDALEAVLIQHGAKW